mgnify:CR=1 FL=1
MPALKINHLFWITVLMFCVSCEGKLSDEQRKQLRKAKKLQQIKVVTEAEITSAAMVQGQKILNALEKYGKGPEKIDSIATATNATIRWLRPGTKNAKVIENQLIEAYLISAMSGGAQENVQKHGSDSLIYTKPVIDEMPDGSVQVNGMWSIWLSKKEIVLSIEKD